MPISKNRGYVSAVVESPDLAAFAEDLCTLDEFRDEVLRKIDEFPERRLTRQELKRDLGYSASGMRLLDRSKWFSPQSHNGAKRKTYDMQEALRLKVLLPGLTQAPTVRTVRKQGNITTIMRQTAQRLVRA